LARGDDLISPIAVCVCRSHRRALKEPPSFSLKIQQQFGSKKEAIIAPSALLVW
jgi:hypothetical protein